MKDDVLIDIKDNCVEVMKKMQEPSSEVEIILLATIGFSNIIGMCEGALAMNKNIKGE